jgi:hypothetical protein
MDLLVQSDPHEWGYASYSLFEKMNLNKLFGKAAADYLDNLITTGLEDYKGIYNDLIRKIKLISKLSDTLNRFMQLFDQVLPDDIYQHDNKDEKKLSLFLYFEGHLSVHKIADMERYSRLWDMILSTFSRLTGEENLTLDITSFNDGNFTLGVIAEDKILDALSAGFVGILSSLPVVLQIRKTQIEISSLPLNKNFTELLEEEIETLINQRALDLAQKLLSDYQHDNFDSDEMTNAISRSLKQILNFVEKGGKVEFKPQTLTQGMAITNKILIDSYALAVEIESITDRIDHSSGKKVILTDNSEAGITTEEMNNKFDILSY